MTIEELYENYYNFNSLGIQSNDGEKAFQLLLQAQWYSHVACFDPLTAEALPLPLSEVLQKTPKEAKPIRDRLWRITEHARQPL